MRYGHGIPFMTLRGVKGSFMIYIYIYIYTLLFVGTYPMPRSVQSVLPVDNSCTAIRYLLNTGHVRTFLF